MSASTFTNAVEEGGRAALVVIADGRLVSAEVGQDAAASGVTVAVAGDERRLLDVPDPDALTALHDAFVGDVVVVTRAQGRGRRQPDRRGPGGVRRRCGELPPCRDRRRRAERGHRARPVVDVGRGPLVRQPGRRGAGGAGCGRAVRRHPGLRPRRVVDGAPAPEPGSRRHDQRRGWRPSAASSPGCTSTPSSTGQAGAADVAGVYFGEDDQVHDFRSLQDHRASRTASNLLLKGAVVDEAHAVYTGMIRVHEGAKATESFLANRNLVLSDGAFVDSVPNLEIVNENDIKSCGHAAATGPVDEEHVFYLESRGVPTEVAAAADRVRVLRRRHPGDPGRGRARARSAPPSRRKLGQSRCLSSSACARATSSSPARPAASTSAATASASCGSVTTSTPSATSAPTRTTRCPTARSSPTSGRSSAGSTGRRSRWSTASRSRCRRRGPCRVYDVTIEGNDVLVSKA